MKRTFLFKALCVAGIAATAATANAQVSGAIYHNVRAATQTLKSEIERDEKIVGRIMTVVNLRNTRKLLTEGLERKEQLARKLVKFRRPAIQRAIELFAQTAEDERKIVKGVSVSHRHKRNAYSTIKDNIPKKKKALRIFESWLEGGAAKTKKSF